MRLFIASPVTLNDYDRLQERFSPFLSGKWVERENLHLTWKFLGKVTAEQLDDTIEKVRRIPLLEKEIPLTVLGSFGRPPRLFYATTPNPLLRKKAVDMQHIGWDMDLKRFHPHVTLCRIKLLKERERFRQKMQEYRNRTIGTIHPQIHLYRSEQGKRGPIYTILA